MWCIMLVSLHIYDVYCVMMCLDSMRTLLKFQFGLVKCLYFVLRMLDGDESTKREWGSFLY
jgi:hypothetical protein